MIFRKTEEFQKRYEELPFRIQEKVKKQLRLMAENSHHPSLKIHRLNGEWEFYIDIHYRCLFYWEKEVITLLTIGTHRIVDRYKIRRGKRK